MFAPLRKSNVISDFANLFNQAIFFEESSAKPDFDPSTCQLIEFAPNNQTYLNLKQIKAMLEKEKENLTSI